ncbi:acylphosphatase [Vibrio renipiscarius]|uniref:acylphosphatase n=1 Tax=Vibrio renipiscarius TaxID=1461322 RepID=UPI00354ADCA6
MMPKGMKFKICGKVQGVGFRYHTAYFALSIGLTGYAKNLVEGDVEVVAYGTDAQLVQMEEFLVKGPRGSRVDGVVKEEIVDTAKRYNGFNIL